MDDKQIIMNFTRPPSVDDVMAMASDAFSLLPEELLEFCNETVLNVENFPDELVQQEQDLDDSYELLALYRSGKEISPGVEKKITGEDDILILYRRPILDLWAEEEEDLGVLIRQVMIEELGRSFDFGEDEIDDMVNRHYQGLL